MSWFQLIPTSNVAFVFLLLSAIFTGFLLRIPDKRPATRVLTAYFVLYTLQMLAGFLWLSTYLPWQRIFDTFQGVFALFAVVGYMHFAYAFLGNPFPREMRVMLIALGALVTLLNGFNFYQGVTVAFLPEFVPSPLFPRYNISVLSLPVLAFTYLWTIGVFLRKSVRASREALHEHDGAPAGDEGDGLQVHRGGPGRKAFALLTLLLGLLSPQSQRARGLRAFGLLSTLPLVFLLSLFLQRAGVVSLQTSLYFAGLSNGLFLMGFVVLFVNHAPEPSTLQAKLIGLSLVTVLLILALIGITVFPYSDLAEGSGNRPVDFTTLRFEPAPDGGYAMRPLDALRYESALGTHIALRDDGNAAIALPFGFSFYGRRWDSVHVSANGILAFGGNVNPPGNEVYAPLRDFYDARPKIAPLFTDLRPGPHGGVHVRAAADRAVFSWREVPGAGHPYPNTFQVVLHAGGAIDFSYNGVAPLLERGVIGIYPGGDDAHVVALPHAEARAAFAPPGAALVDDFTAHFRSHTHEKIRSLTWLILLVAAFILLVFPRFFRRSLVVPLNNLLEGVRQANAGNLDVRVPVAVNDEIGFLSMNFNQMAQSLKQAAHARERLMTMEQELAIASRIQMSTLPQNFPTHDRIDLFALMHPAKEVGGDFYDFFAIDDHRLGVAIGDVSGKGIGAAMFMAIVRTTLHTTAMQGVRPDECVRHVNRILYPENQAEMFVTLFYGVLDTRSGCLSYCNAGHNPPIVLARREAAYLARPKNIAVGLEPSYDFRALSVTMHPGDVLFLYTDGVTEAANHEADMFSEERLVHCLAAADGRPARALIDDVRARMDRFAAGVHQSDDITMLAMRFLGEDPIVRERAQTSAAHA